MNVWSKVKQLAKNISVDNTAAPDDIEFLTEYSLIMPALEAGCA